MKSLLRCCAIILSTVSVQARYIVSDSVLSTADESYTSHAAGIDGLFSAANAPGLGANALSRVAFVNSKGETTHEPQLLPLAPESVYVNGATVATTDDSMYDKEIVAMNAVGNLPVVAYDGTGKNIAIVTNPFTGTTLIKNTHVLNGSDASPFATPHVRSIAMSHSHVFAAVEKGASFAEATDGIVVLKLAPGGFYSDYTPTSLAPVDANTGNVGNAAAAITHAMTETDAGTLIKNIRHIHWDGQLQRLFISLELDTLNGTSVLVGHMNGDALTIEPIVGDVLTSTNKIVSAKGFALGSNPVIQQTSVMHTSTGKSYLVIWGDRAASPELIVSAVPLIAESDTAQNIGKLAKVTDLAAVPTANADLYDSDSTAANVGSIGLTGSDSIISMHVMGDSVFITRDNTTSPAQRGVYKSTALFDKSGLIRAWTPWEKVVTDVHATAGAGGVKVQGFAQDGLGQIFTQMTTNTGINAISVHTWGTADSNGMLGGTATDASLGIISRINIEFPSASGGVSRIVSLPGDYIAACGKEKIMFASPGQAVTNGNAGDAESEVAVVDLGEGSGIVTSVIFKGSSGSYRSLVGTSKGLYIVAKAAGAVFDQDALAAQGLQVIAEVGSFTDIIDLSLNGNDLFVLCSNGVYHVDISGITWSDGTGIATTVLATPKVLCGSDAHRFLCFARTGTSAKSNLLIGTSNGLFRVHDSHDVTLSAVSNTLDANGWQHIYRDGNNTPFSVIRHLFWLSAGSPDTNGGNCYVLSADTSLNTAVVYRLNVPEGLNGSAEAIAPITYTIHSIEYEYFYLIGRYREHIFTDGAYFYDGCSHHHEHKELLITQPITPDYNLVQHGYNLTSRRFYRASWGAEIPLLIEDETVINTLFVEPFTGGLMVPGEWGVRVRQ